MNISPTRCGVGCGFVMNAVQFVRRTRENAGNPSNPERKTATNIPFRASSLALTERAGRCGGRVPNIHHPYRDITFLQCVCFLFLKVITISLYCTHHFGTLVPALGGGRRGGTFLKTSLGSRGQQVET